MKSILFQVASKAWEFLWNQTGRKINIMISVVKTATARFDLIPIKLTEVFLHQKRAGTKLFTQVTIIFQALYVLLTRVQGIQSLRIMTNTYLFTRQRILSRGVDNENLITNTILIFTGGNQEWIAI